MFEVGKAYMFRLLEGSEDGPAEVEQWFEVAAVEGNLLKLLGPDFTDSKYDDFFEISPGEGDRSKREEMILNTSSAFFHSAKLAKTEE